MLRAATIASGSSGNCAVVSDGKVHILIDAGISAKRIVTALRQLGIELSQIAGILITHEHSDHISGLDVLCRQTGADLYTAEATARQICYRRAGMESRFQVFDPGQRFAIGDLVIHPFANSHDCACPVGYAVEKDGCKIALCTDTGYVTPEAESAVLGSRLLICESNHDVDMLRSGSYPAYLKERILGDRGHLSNEAGAALAAKAVQQGAARVVLAHLSQENNTPALALAASARALEDVGAQIGRDVILTAAPRNDPSDWMEV